MARQVDARQPFTSPLPADLDPWPCPTCGRDWGNPAGAIECCWDEEGDR